MIQINLMSVKVLAVAVAEAAIVIGSYASLDVGGNNKA